MIFGISVKFNHYYSITTGAINGFLGDRFALSSWLSATTYLMTNFQKIYIRSVDWCQSVLPSQHFYASTTPLCPREHVFRSKQILSDRGTGCSLSAGSSGRSKEHVGRTTPLLPPRVDFFLFLCSFWQKLCQIIGFFRRPGKTFQLWSPGSTAWRNFRKKKELSVMKQQLYLHFSLSVPYSFRVGTLLLNSIFFYYRMPVFSKLISLHIPSLCYI